MTGCGAIHVIMSSVPVSLAPRAERYSEFHVGGDQLRMIEGDITARQQTCPFIQPAAPGQGSALIGNREMGGPVQPRQWPHAILLIAYPLNPPVTAANFDSFIPTVGRVVGRGFEQNGGVLQAGPEKITVGGMPALQFRGTGQSSPGIAVGRTLTFAFRGTTFYEINCQHTRAG
jgi:hypothetical protein